MAYVETNRLLASIGERLVATLAAHGVRAVGRGATHVFDKQRLMAKWSHKSIACITGLGSFGLHSLVITDAGCAGRFGSVVIDVDPGVSPAPERTRCLYFHNGSCGLCVTRCPVSALSHDALFDRQAATSTCRKSGFTSRTCHSPMPAAMLSGPSLLHEGPGQRLNPGLAHTGGECVDKQRGRGHCARSGYRSYAIAPSDCTATGHMSCSLCHAACCRPGHAVWQCGVSCLSYFAYSSSPAMGTRQTNRSVSLPVFTTW
jgi:ferredoxin